MALAHVLKAKIRHQVREHNKRRDASRRFLGTTPRPSAPPVVGGKSVLQLRCSDL